MSVRITNYIRRRKRTVRETAISNYSFTQNRITTYVVVCLIFGNLIYLSINTSSNLSIEAKYYKYIKNK